jgi:hypothetical protein
VPQAGPRLHAPRETSPAAPIALPLRFAAVSYLHCPRCRLTIAERPDSLLVNCPRCLARAAVVSPLFASPLRAAERDAEGHSPAHAAG